ncbi:MAG: DUF2334 domain-containing protein [Chloroflexota bacterium]
MYGQYWDRIPISLAVVPVHASTRSKGIPAEHWKGAREFPLGENRELVEFLKDSVADGRVSIVLHGYSHKNYPDGYEFEVAPDLEGRLRRGLGYLEALLGVEIGTFVPPHNALSKTGLQAVDKVGLNVLGSFYSFRPDKKPLDRFALANYVRISRHRLRTGRGRHQRLIYPWPLRYNRHAEFGCQPLVPRTTLDELLTAFEEARRFGGDFCLATHYWEIDDRLAGMLDAFIAHADRAGVEWVPADDLFAEPAR